MKVFKYILTLICSVLLLGSCVKEFDPPSQGYENFLVVESFLSDGNEPFKVMLSRTVPIDTSGFLPEQGAKISLLEVSGESYSLTESSPGNYQYFGQINTQVGKNYKIQIQTASGSMYESKEVTMRDTPDFDDIRFEFQEKSNGLVGMQIYLSTHDDDNEIGYYRWEWDETWIFRTPFDSNLIWEDSTLKLRDDNINNCWKFDNSSTIEISTSKDLSQNLISDYPIRFVSTKSDRLKIRYSINVKQYTLNEESYSYWNELRKITESLGTLFDPQPTVLIGNIKSITNPDEIVIGYFDASVLTEKRIFIEQRDIPPTAFANFFPYCEDSVVSQSQIPEMLRTGYMLISTKLNEAGFPAYNMAAPICVDCRLFGTNVKPDYW